MIRVLTETECRSAITMGEFDPTIAASAPHEDTLGNREVPYIRFYREGTLAGETNFISSQLFISRLTT